MPLRVSVLALAVLACAGCSTPTALTQVPGGIDLGSSRAGDAIEFEIPTGTVGFTLVVDAAVTADDFLGVQSLEDPLGAMVVQDFHGTALPGRALTGPNGTGVGAVRVPLVDDRAADPVVAGRWKVRLGGSTRVAGAAKGAVTAFTGSVHGTVRLQTAATGGVIDVDFYVPEGLSAGAHTLSAATAGSDAELAARLDLVFGLFDRLYGIGRGEVRFHPIDARFKSVSGELELEGAHQQATAESDRPRAQVVLTNTLSPDGSGQISGNCDCLPGAVGVAGNVCSSVVVALRDGAQAWEDAATVVHELGHFAGLNHTSEFDGHVDTLADTPECATTGKAQLASCADRDDLMFPSVNQTESEASIWVSATQRAVVRSSALFRAGP